MYADNVQVSKFVHIYEYGLASQRLVRQEHRDIMVHHTFLHLTTGANFTFTSASTLVDQTEPVSMYMLVSSGELYSSLKRSTLKGLADYIRTSGLYIS